MNKKIEKIKRFEQLLQKHKIEKLKRLLQKHKKHIDATPSIVASITQPLQNLGTGEVRGPMSLFERRIIEALIKLNVNLMTISRYLGRRLDAANTEVHRRGDRKTGVYDAEKAHKLALRFGRQGRWKKLNIKQEQEVILLWELGFSISIICEYVYTAMGIPLSINTIKNYIHGYPK